MGHLHWSPTSFLSPQGKLQSESHLYVLSMGTRHTFCVFWTEGDIFKFQFGIFWVKQYWTVFISSRFPRFLNIQICWRFLRVFHIPCFLKLLDYKYTLKSNIQFKNSTVHQTEKKYSSLLNHLFFLSLYDYASFVYWNYPIKAFN